MTDHDDQFDMPGFANAALRTHTAAIVAAGVATLAAPQKPDPGEGATAPLSAGDRGPTGPLRARKTDPATSHAAAQSISEEAIADSQVAVLESLKVHGPGSDEEIVSRVDWDWLTPFSSSRIRTARNELALAGFVTRLPEDGRTSRGRRCQRWAITPKGIAALQKLEERT